MPDAVLISKWAWCSRRGLVSVSVKLHQELCAFSCVGALQQGVSGRVDVAERFDHGSRIAPLPPPLPSPSHPALVSSSLVNRRTTLRRQSSRLRAPSSAPPPRVCPAPVQAQDVELLVRPPSSRSWPLLTLPAQLPRDPRFVRLYHHLPLLPLPPHSLNLYQAQRHASHARRCALESSRA